MFRTTAYPFIAPVPRPAGRISPLTERPVSHKVRSLSFPQSAAFSPTTPSPRSLCTERRAMSRRSTGPQRADHESRLDVAYGLIADGVPARVRPTFEAAWQEFREGFTDLLGPRPSPPSEERPNGSDGESGRPSLQRSAGAAPLAHESRGSAAAGMDRPAAAAPIQPDREPELTERILRIFPRARAAAVRALRDHWPSEDAVRTALARHAESSLWRSAPASDEIELETLTRGWCLDADVVTTLEMRSTNTRREAHREQSVSGPALEGLWERPPLEESASWRRRGSETVEPCGACGGDGRTTCAACGGEGRRDAPCTFCGGSGRIRATGSSKTAPECHRCGGTGTVPGPCSECRGEGRIECATCEGVGRLFVYQEIHSRVRAVSQRELYLCEGVDDRQAERAGGVRLPDRSWQRPAIALRQTSESDEIATRQTIRARAIPVTEAVVRLGQEGSADPIQIALVGIGAEPRGALSLPVDRRRVAIAALVAVGVLATLALLLI